MKVSEAMSRDVRLVAPDCSLRDAARAMAEGDVGALPVGADDRLVGMITDRDIAVRAVAEGLGPTTTVEEIMTPEVKYCFADEDTAHVARNMGDQQLRRLPVVDRSKRLVGILSLADVAQHEADGRRVGKAYRDISQSGGEHNQSEDI